MAESAYSKTYQCDHKNTYQTKAKAKQMAKQMQTFLGRKGAGAGRLQAYKCPHCGWFHVGHLSQEQRAVRRAAWEAEAEAPKNF